ncbi:MAG: T9SS type A sorting domain-containing protein [Ignavibacteriaceae bacterium]|nr:T9SS type A sorting domain-containing protein [Ignavibacteriaceae bacterium]
MRNYYIIICLIFQYAVFVYSQNNDFQISRDSAPATFIQQSPKLYANKNGGYIVVWQDLREGEPAYYAQVYDSLNKPVGKNFKLNSNEHIYFSTNNFVSLKTTEYDYGSAYYSWSYFQVSGSIYNKEYEPIKEINLARGEYPWCGTGYLGTQPEAITTDSSFIFFFMNDGSVTTARYDYAGNLLTHLNPDSANLPLTAGSISADINNKGKYFLAWLNSRNNNLPIGYYGTLFNSKDSIIISNKLLLPYPSDSTNEIYFQPGYLSCIKVKTVSDSLFEVFFVRKDSLKLTYAKYDDKGNIIGCSNEIKIPYYKSENVNAYYNITSCSLVSIDKDLFGIALSANTYNWASNKMVNSIIYFDKDGNKSGNEFTDTTSQYDFSNGISLTGINNYVIPVQGNGDIYLKYYNNLSLMDSIKVNDDLSGNNQLNLFVRKVNDNKFVSSWQDENGYKARYIDINGNNVGEIFDLSGYASEYFSDGSSITLWEKTISDSYYRLGYSVLNQSGDIVYEDSLVSSDDSYYLKAEAKIISDSTFIVVYGKYGSTIITSFDRKANKLNEYILPASPGSYLQIYLENKDSLWVTYDNKVQLFSSKLVPLSQIINISPTIILGDNKFLLTTQFYTNGLYSYNGYIVNSAADTIKSNIPLAYNADEVNITNLAGDKFIVLYRIGNKIFEKAFSNSGNVLSDSLQIDDGKSSYKKLPCVAATGNKVMFTWSDARNQGNGYDIYGSLFDLSKITNVKKISNTIPSSFYLSQNFPNPFNPSTKIRFSIPATATGSVNVQIKIYDILGKEIVTLLNEGKSAGTYEIEFNTMSNSRLKNLSSGIYFYQIKAGEFVDTKKFILLK